MRRGRDLPILREIVAIRTAQAVSAEAKVARAAAGRRGLEQQRAACLKSLVEGEVQWRGALSGRTLSLPLALAWAGALDDRRGRLRDVDNRIVQAASEAAQLARAWRVARDRVETARDQTRAASKALQRTEEEAALNDVTEWIAHRRRRL